MDTAADAVEFRACDGADAGVEDEAAVGKRDSRPPNIPELPSVEADGPPLLVAVLDEPPALKKELADGEAAASALPLAAFDSVLDTISVSYSGLSRVPINVK